MMTPSSLPLVQRYSPSNDFVNNENIKSLTRRISVLLVHIGTPLPHEVDISILLESNHNGLLLPIHLVHLTVKDELMGLYSVVVVSSLLSTDNSKFRSSEHFCALLTLLTWQMTSTAEGNITLIQII